MRPSRKTQPDLLAAWIFGPCLLAFFLLVFLFAPSSLPEFKQRMLGVIAALLSGLFAFFLTGTVGIKWVSGKSVLGQIAVKATGGLAVFALVLWWWFSQKAPIAVEKTLQKTAEIERYTKGGSYPRITVEPYFGPSEGIRRSLVTTPEKPGFLAVIIENTNEFPIFDLEITMLDLTPQGRDPRTMETFNEKLSATIRQMPTFHPNKIISDLLPANTNCPELDFDFNTKTRAADTWHKLRFKIISNRWETATTLTDVKTGKILANDLSPNYPREVAKNHRW